MARYIDADLIDDQLVREFAEENAKTPYMGTHFIEKVIAGLFLKKIKKIPTADVAPVVHGKWVREDELSAECSVCAGRVVLDDWDEPAVYDYCPHCGAKMDTEDDE